MKRYISKKYNRALPVNIIVIFIFAGINFSILATGKTTVGIGAVIILAILVYETYKCFGRRDLLIMEVDPDKMIYYDRNRVPTEILKSSIKKIRIETGFTGNIKNYAVYHGDSTTRIPNKDINEPEWGEEVESMLKAIKESRERTSA